MHKWIALVASLIACACGGGHDRGDDDGSGSGSGSGSAVDILAQLQALPGVSVTELTSSQTASGYRYFELEFTEPVDHTQPSGPTFQVEVSLMHRDVTVPMIAATSGYDDYIADSLAEPTLLLHANQISIEHRYFGTSYPADDPQWTYCTIDQMAGDEHAIISELGTIYAGAWVTTGGSKGGMTAVFDHRFYPDDAAGTLAYVAPLSFAIPDARYGSNLYEHPDDPGMCRAHVEAFTTDLLQNRRAALVSAAMSQATAMGYTYTRIAIGPAVESAVRDFEWTFWQYYGEQDCTLIPIDPTTLSDADAFQLLDALSPISFSDDDSTDEFQTYFVQAYSQLGSPGTVAVRGDADPPYLDAYSMYSDTDFSQTFPASVAAPTYDPAPMQDIDTYVQSAASAHYIFIYGENDPWSGGEFRLGSSSDSMLATVADGTHGASLAELGSDDQVAAFAKLQAWTGVTPDPTQLGTSVVLRDVRDPRVFRATESRRLRRRRAW
ncbi:MAG TPA: S28 family serine protease [Kofleriaceae bacterium]|jgi:hypothetical protein